MSTPRPTTAVSRRTAIAGLSAGGAGLALAAITRKTAAQDATPAAMAGHPLVGTWIVDRNPADPSDMPTTNVLTADGGLTDPSVGAAGVWNATGERTADFTLIAIFAELNSYFLVRGTLEADDTGDTATAMASQTHVSTDGTVLDQAPASKSTYIRLRVEPTDAVGQPFAKFPAWIPATPSPATPTS